MSDAGEQQRDEYTVFLDEALQDLSPAQKDEICKGAGVEGLRGIERKSLLKEAIIKTAVQRGFLDDSNDKEAARKIRELFAKDGPNGLKIGDIARRNR